MWRWVRSSGTRQCARDAPRGRLRPPRPVRQLQCAGPAHPLQQHANASAIRLLPSAEPQALRAPACFESSSVGMQSSGRETSSRGM
eukprot:6312496-Alexandrium_andersonii.AAC.1